MCGFTLIVFKNKKKIKINKETLRHRGPDKTRYIYSNGINLKQPIAKSISSIEIKDIK